jgi:uncharacterized RDD family membrane protein YckC
MEYASIAWRAWALILDTVILMIIGYFVAADVGTATGAGYELNLVWVVVTFLIWFAYYVVMETTFGGTIGKLLVGLHVVKTQGCRITLREALIRNAMRIVDGLLFYAVGAVSIWSSPLHQRLGDRLAGTVVVRGAIEPSRPEVCNARA